MINRLGHLPKPKKTICWTILKPFKGWRLIKIKGQDGVQLFFVAAVWLTQKNEIVSWKVFWTSLEAGDICKMSDEEIIETSNTGWNVLDKDIAQSFFPEFSTRARYRTG